MGLLRLALLSALLTAATPQSLRHVAECLATLDCTGAAYEGAHRLRTSACAR